MTLGGGGGGAEKVCSLQRCTAGQQVVQLLRLLESDLCPRLCALRATSHSWALQESLGEPECLVLHVLSM